LRLRSKKGSFFLQSPQSQRGSLLAEILQIRSSRNDGPR
jgi:hypothetical protein